MRTSDRTSRLLLTLIAVFLGILVGKALFQQAPQAVAQTTTAAPSGLSVLQNYNQNTLNGTDGAVYTYRTIPVSSISVSSKDQVKSIHVVDTASSFILQFSDRIEVYRIDGTNLTELAAQANQN